MNNKKYKQTVDPNVETPQEWKGFKKGANTITTSKSTRKNPHLKGAMLNLIRSVGFYNCRRMQEVSRTETIGHRADFR
jgi:hypothetical protein